MSALAPELLARLFDREPVARLAVRNDTDVPEVMPIVFSRVGSCLFSPIDGKPKSSARLARLRYIERCPQVGLVLDRYADDWRELWWLRISALATIAVGHHAQWDAAVAALAAKYPQYRSTPLFSGEPTMICFEPLTVRAWAAVGLERWAQDYPADTAPRATSTDDA